jgi:hypothetical protein
MVRGMLTLEADRGKVVRNRYYHGPPALHISEGIKSEGQNTQERTHSSPHGKHIERGGIVQPFLYQDNTSSS